MDSGKILIEFLLLFYSIDRLFLGQIASLNRKRDHLSAVVYQNQLMAIAGFDTAGHAQNTVEEYDEERDEWIEVSPLNAATGRMGAFVLSLFD